MAADAVAADGFIGVGIGVKHSEGAAAHLQAEIAHGWEVHYGFWRDGERDHAVGIGYRFDNSVSPISVVLGIAYVGTITENLLRHEDAYIEIRYNINERFACQASHYSTVGDDAGENFVLCGWRWRQRN